MIHDPESESNNLKRYEWSHNARGCNSILFFSSHFHVSYPLLFFRIVKFGFCIIFYIRVSLVSEYNSYAYTTWYLSLSWGVISFVGNCSEDDVKLELLELCKVVPS